MESQYKSLFKVVLIGDSPSGKTSLVHRYINDSFKEQFHSTIGAEFATKELQFDGSLYKLQIWDTAGQQRFKSLMPIYYKNSSAVIVIYDITNRQSFDHIDKFYRDAKEMAGKHAVVVIVGTKNDLNEERKVKEEEGRDFAASKNIDFIQVSSKTSMNVNQLFDNILNRLVACPQE